MTWSHHKLPIRTGCLIRISHTEHGGKKEPSVVKLYSCLNDLKTNSFMGCATVLAIMPDQEAFITMVVETAFFDYQKTVSNPVVEAVKIIVNHNTWWMFSYDVHEVLN